MSQLFGRFHSDDGTPSDPPGVVRVEVPGVAAKLELSAMEWVIERVLPSVNGSLIECKGALYVLAGNSWYKVDNPAVEVDVSDLKDYILVLDTAGWKFS